MLRSLQKFGRIELPAATSWVGIGEGQMEEDCGGDQGLTKGCGAKGMMMMMMMMIGTASSWTMCFEALAMYMGSSSYETTFHTAM
jgi:hypothetical protein